MSGTSGDGGILTGLHQHAVADGNGPSAQFRNTSLFNSVQLRWSPQAAYFMWIEILSAHTSQQWTVERSDEIHKFCKIPLSLLAPFILTDHCRLTKV